MVRFRATAVWLLGMMLAAGAPAQEKPAAQQAPKEKAADPAAGVSFKDDVFPIIRKHCLPCHAENQENPSELSLDTHALLMKGGRHGSAVEAGKAEESALVTKLEEKPPFGGRMPLNSRKKVKEGKAKWLTGEEVRTIATWVSEGAKDN